LTTGSGVGIGKLLKNLPALRQVGFQANRRLLDVQRFRTIARSGREHLTGWCVPSKYKGFNNQEMHALLAPLRLHGIIECILHSHRYKLTPDGLRIALFFSRAYARLLRPKLEEIMPQALPNTSALRAAFDRLNCEIDCCEN
jgi:hypothetical protein